MKRIAGIFLLSIYIFSFAEVHNLVKIPVLFQHFNEHKQEDEHISFWDFIRIHYMEPISVDEDYHRDQQLPFRDAGCCLVASANACECPPVNMEIGLLPETQREFHLTNDMNIGQYRAYDIFQPPRKA